MAFYVKSATNGTLRKLYRQAKTIAKNSEVGSKPMCPCGCLQNFKKETKTQVYSTVGGTKHKDRYNNRVRSKSEYAFDEGMLKIRSVMRTYVAKNQDKLDTRANRKKAKSTPEEVSLSIVSDKPTSENLVAVMKQVKSLNKTCAKGASVICPCGCGDVFCKTTPHHAFSRKNGEECKDKYYETTRTEKPIEMSVEKVLSFKFLHVAAKKEIENRKANTNTVKSTTRRRR